ncbi:phosphotransferase family protein [Metabacillus litoralis]|uniref:Aminoglycoside phosphotransferase domain-containing protein n=1 Tax=Metabacillus litoralis TaxID=152268 RepID=A0A179SKD3_9BACI|nr:phosphotransferase [Metabacillus litoralis]OAS82167.1 hypothetical protein A6K24_14030 [Metabacillus litoralis]
MNSLLEKSLQLLKLNKKDVQFIGDGFGSLVLEDQNGMIIRIAKNLDTAKQYKKEYKILPQIQATLSPIKIPKPTWCHFDQKNVPFGIIMYEKLAGLTLNPKLLLDENKITIAKQLGAFIALIHQIPVNHFKESCSQEINNRNHIAKLRSYTNETLKNHLTTKEMSLMDVWWEETLKDKAFYSYKPVLCHGDLWYENILMNKKQTSITGIIDFSDMKIGDPAIDLVPHHYLGEDFYSLVLSEYSSAFPEDHTIDDRVKRHRGLRELTGLEYAIKHKDDIELKDSIAKIGDVILGTRKMDFS